MSCSSVYLSVWADPLFFPVQTCNSKTKRIFLLAWTFSRTSNQYASCGLKRLRSSNDKNAMNTSRSSSVYVFTYSWCITCQSVTQHMCHRYTRPVRGRFLLGLVYCLHSALRHVTSEQSAAHVSARSTNISGRAGRSHCPCLLQETLKSLRIYSDLEVGS